MAKSAAERYLLQLYTLLAEDEVKWKHAATLSGFVIAGNSAKAATKESTLKTSSSSSLSSSLSSQAPASKRVPLSTMDSASKQRLIEELAKKRELAEKNKAQRQLQQRPLRPLRRKRALNSNTVAPSVKSDALSAVVAAARKRQRIDHDHDRDDDAVNNDNNKERQRVNDGDNDRRGRVSKSPLPLPLPLPKPVPEKQHERAPPPKVAVGRSPDKLQEMAWYAKTLFVGNLPTMGTRDLHDLIAEHFKVYGYIENVRVVSAKAYAYVTFETPEQVAAAIDGATNTSLVEGTAPLHVAQHLQTRLNEPFYRAQHAKPDDSVANALDGLSFTSNVEPTPVDDDNNDNNDDDDDERGLVAYDDL
jgi:RNA recognition motif